MDVRNSVPSPLVVNEDGRRCHHRVRALSHLIMQVDDCRRIVSIENISLSGAAVFSLDMPEPGTAVLLTFPTRHVKPGALNQVSGRVVRLAGTGVFGIAFDPGQERTIQSILGTLPAVRVARGRTEAKAPRRRKARPRATAKPRPRKRPKGRQTRRGGPKPKRR